MKVQEERKQFELVVCGKKIFGVLHLPKNNRSPVPYVMMLHGFGGTRTGRHRYLVLLSEALSTLGIASIRFDFRGAGDSEGDLSEQTVLTQLEDCYEIHKFAKTLPELDEQRFGLFGRSFGGYIATLSASKILPQALALAVPFGGWLYQKENSPIQYSAAISGYTFMGAPIASALIEEVKAISLPEELAKLLTIPLLHIHAEKDQIVTNIDCSVYKASRMEGSVSEFISYPSSDHEFNHYQERLHSIQKIAQFFQLHLITKT